MGGLGGGGYAARRFCLFSFPCSADHKQNWPPCKVVFFGLATNNTLNVRNNNNNIHLEVGRKSSGRSHREVRGKPSGYGPHVRCLVYGYQMLLMQSNINDERSTRLDRENETENNLVTNE